MSIPPAQDDPGIQRDIDRYTALWQRDQLAAIYQHLPVEWRARYDALVAELGEPDNPDFTSYITVGEVPPSVSPRSPEELTEMGPGDIVAYLSTWQPAPDAGWPLHEGEPSAEGLADALVQAVHLNPTLFQREAARFAAVAPVYQLRLLYGLAVYAREVGAFDWPPVLLLCESIVGGLYGPRAASGSEETPGTAGVPGEVAAVHSPAQVADSLPFAIANLLDAGLGREGAQLPAELRAQAWQIISLLATDADPNMRASALRLVVLYSAWVFRQSEAPGSGLDAVPEVAALLDQHLDGDGETALKVRAVYGRYLPWLARVDPGWVGRNLRRMLPLESAHRQLWQATWGGYLKNQNPASEGAQLLHEDYLRGIENLNLTKAGDRTARDDGPFVLWGMGSGAGTLDEGQRRLVEHLMVLYWRGDIEIEGHDPLLQRFYTDAPLGARMYAIEFVGDVLHTADEERDRAIMDRLKAMWESRARALANVPAEQAAELAAFSAWFTSRKFDEGWTLVELQQVLRTARIIQVPYLVVERLSEYPENKLEAVLDCLELLLDGAKTLPLAQAYASGWVDKAKPILTAGVGSKDKRICEAAVNLVNRFIASGYENRGLEALLTGNPCDGSADRGAR